MLFRFPKESHDSTGGVLRMVDSSLVMFSIIACGEQGNGMPPQGMSVLLSSAGLGCSPLLQL